MNPVDDHGHMLEPEHALSAAVPSGPEDRSVFRLAQLTLLLQVTTEEGAPVRTVDRLGFYDFFSANPFVVVSGDDDRDVADRLALRLAGFSNRQLSYASTGQRFVSRRRRLQHDLSLLVAYGLAAVDSTGYVLTSSGRELRRWTRFGLCRGVQRRRKVDLAAVAAAVGSAVDPAGQ
jgi:hypothetical protein